MAMRGPVGAGLLAKAAARSILMSSDTPLSRASRIVAPPLPQVLRGFHPPEIYFPGFFPVFRSCCV
ncbi:hypothetical protein BZ163_12765 [Pseudomonas sp. VI4.1]|nr:hypothetical protein BZ163_12765 [Pseudomonas sp. VI4.1]